MRFEILYKILYKILLSPELQVVKNEIHFNIFYFGVFFAMILSD